MNKFVLLCAAYACAALSSPCLAGPKSDISKLEAEVNAAYAANDLEKYFGYYTDDALFWFPEGQTDLPHYKKDWGEFLGSGAGITSAKTANMHVRLSPAGDVVIASYVLHLGTREADKSTHTDDHQETDVWIKTPAGWKIAHVHYSDVPPPKKH